MQFSSLPITLLAFMTLSVAFPTGISFSEDLKAVIAQKRTQERDLATSNSLSEEKRAYQLEITEVATFKYKRDLGSALSETSSAPSRQTEESPSAVGNRFDPNFNPGNIVENFADALDEGSPGYVGLGNVMETLE